MENKDNEKTIDIDKIVVKPFELTPDLLEHLKKVLLEKKKLLEYHKNWIIQLTPDIEEIEETIMNAGVTREMIDRWNNLV